MKAEQFFNNGFGADVEKVHRKHVIDLMTNFAKHYHTEQCDIADIVGRSEQLQGFFEFYKQKFGGGFNTDVLEITLKQYEKTL